MKNQSFSIALPTNQSPEAVFKAVNNVRAWWTENLAGSSNKLDDEFEVRFGDVHYSRQKITAFIPGKKITWLVTDSNLSFINNKTEWTGTKIIFRIDQENGQTILHFIHEGLVPEIECYNACSNAWSGYIKDSLHKLIQSGT